MAEAPGDSAREPLPVRLATAYRTTVVLLALALPAAALGYLLALPSVGRFEHHAAHVAIITLGNVVAFATAAVAWMNYRATGEPALRLMTVAFAAFGGVYVWHGFLTPLADANARLFLAYGPVARLVFLLYLLAAVVRMGARPDSTEARRRGWWPHLAAVAAIDLAVGVAASWGVAMATFRLFEWAALVVAALVFVAFASRRERATPMTWTLVAVLVLAVQASGTFLLASPWNHVWWLAHVTFAAAFLVMGLGMVRSFLTTRSARHIFSERELLRRLEARTTELEEVNAQLRTANVSLQASNAALDAFSYVVAHDLKEPVRALDMLTREMEEQHAEAIARNADLADLVHMTRRTSDNLARLLGGLLDFSRVAWFNPTDLAPLDLEEAVRHPECSTRYEHALREREGRLLVSAKGARVLGTTAGVCQVFGNLILNSLKHNPGARPVVRVCAEPAQEPGFVQVVVEDNGPGFPSEVRARFETLQPRPSTVKGGFGLAISRRAVEALGGKMWLGKSRELGGAAVHFTLPAPRA